MEQRLNSHHGQISGSNDFLEPTSPPVYPPTIGEPITFSSGNFAGRTLRFELKELQKAESGRKQVSSEVHAVCDRLTSNINTLGMPKSIEDRWILLLRSCFGSSRLETIELEAGNGRFFQSV